MVFERVFMSRVYGSNVLMQLLVCYAFVLIFDDVVKIVWGPEFQSMGMPAAFQVPPLLHRRRRGAAVLPVADRRGAARSRLVLVARPRRTRFGKMVRAAAHQSGDGVGARHQHRLIYARRVLRSAACWRALPARLRRRCAR